MFINSTAKNLSDFGENNSKLDNKTDVFQQAGKNNSINDGITVIMERDLPPVTSRATPTYVKSS